MVVAVLVVPAAGAGDGVATVTTALAGVDCPPGPLQVSV